MADMRGSGCLCGRVRYELAWEPLFSLLCHCRDRQHQSGSAKISVCHGVGRGCQVFCVRRSRETLHEVEGITDHGTSDQG